MTYGGYFLLGLLTLGMIITGTNFVVDAGQCRAIQRGVK
ncbi:hypothetical protein SAMN05880590_102767 [Rhizobium sp. RU35A]|nr:hypothetical protein SAMN05880590_102767 [Rhizobium sp. RU35A]